MLAFAGMAEGDVMPAEASIWWRAKHAFVGLGWIPGQAGNDEI